MSEDEVQSGPVAVAEAGIRLLLERARGGDHLAMPALRAALDDHPEIWARYGDLAAHARAAVIDLVAGTDLGFREALSRKADALIEELAGPGASPLERLLAERVSASWLRVHHADVMEARAAGDSLAQATFARKRVDASHRGFLAAITALATVRCLLPATVEVVAAATTSSSKPAVARHADSTDDGAARGDGSRDGAGAGVDLDDAGDLIPFKPHGGAGSRRRGTGASGRPGTRVTR